MNSLDKASFETIIEQHLPGNGYVSVPREGFEREQAIFPEEAPGVHLRDTARGMGEAGGPAWRQQG